MNKPLHKNVDFAIANLVDVVSPGIWANLSNDLQDIFDNSALIAMSHGKSTIYSEHLLFSAFQFFRQNSEELHKFDLEVEALEKELTGRQLWKKINNAKVNEKDLKLSTTVQRIIPLLSSFKAKGITLTPITLFFAFVCEGTNVASDVIQTVGKTRFTTMTALNEMNLKMVDLNLQTTRDSFASFKIVPTVPSISFVPDAKRDLNLKVIEKMDSCAPSESNWVIYPNLLIGGNPGVDVKKICDLLYLKNEKTKEDIGRNTFVCLMGEFNNANRYQTESYPRIIKQYLDKYYSPPVDCVYFPIHDFEVAEVEPLVQLVAELKRRILAGEKMYLHCRGGHGRTGMVVIPLVAALYQLSFKEASDWVRKSYLASTRGKEWQWRLPETAEQEKLAESIIQQVRKQKRGN